MRWITLLVLAGVLAGCGQKGPLFLESNKAESLKTDPSQTPSQDASQGRDQNTTAQ